MRKPNEFLSGILAAMIISALPASCALLSSMSGFQKPKLRFKQLHLRDMGFDKVTLDFEFELENPNPVGLTFATLDYQLDIDQHQLAKGNSSKAIRLKARETSPLMVPFTVEFRQLAASLHALFSAKDKVPYRLQAGFGIKTPIGVVNLPVDLKGDIPLPRLPAVNLAGFKLKRLDPMGASLEFRIGVRNRGSFPIALSGLGYQAQIAGVSVSEGRSAPADVAAGQSTTITVPISLNFLKLGMSLFKVVRSKKLPYTIGGKLDLGLFKYPFKLTGTAKL